MGLAGSMVAALIVSGFEEQLASNISLAFFLPAIVYLADAVGPRQRWWWFEGFLSACRSAQCSAERS